MDNKKIKGLFARADALLEELVASPSSSIQYIHDDSWNSFPADLRFPAIGLALRDAGAEEQSYCVAISSSPRLWALGVSSKWANREVAAKLAIGLTLASKASNFEVLCVRYPDLRDFCKHLPSNEPESTPEPDGKAWKQDDEPNVKQLNSLPRDSAIWIKLPEDKPRPPMLQELPGRTIA